MKIKTMEDLTKLGKVGEQGINSKTPQLIIGLGTCGLASGAKALKEQAADIIAKANFKADIVPVGCIGLCHCEPLVDVKLPGKPRVTYASVDAEKLDRIVKEHLIGGKAIPELAMAQIGTEVSVAENSKIDCKELYDGIPQMKDLPFFKKQFRIVMRNCGVINPESLEQYVARGGYASALKTLQNVKPDALIEDIKKSGLRGRGGAGFSTGMKWGFARASKGDQKYVICNADEGDPGAYMNRAVLEGDPHSVIEGMLIGGFAIGATEGYIYCRAEYPLAVEMLNNAIKQAEHAGILGKNALNSGFDFTLKLMEGAGAFVCGEETALIASIEGKRGEPHPRPPFPANSGLFAKPSNVNNVETWNNVPLILEKGSDWFSKIGTEKSKGTKVFSLVGSITRAGLVEIKLGTQLKDVVYEIGGGIPNKRKLKAVQTGGPSGGCIPAEHMNAGVDYENLKALGAIMGSGGMVVMDEDTCMVDVARYFLGFTSEESCGQCTPCRVGTRRMLEILERITRGKGREDDIPTLESMSVQIRDASLCSLGGSAPNPVLTTLRYFREEYLEHIREGKCRARVCRSLLRYTITDACTGCTACSKACPVAAISGERKAMHVIDQDKCIRCGACHDVCRFKAVMRQ